ncbi:DUF4232 domain-containing protein [Streptomyces sp. NBC_00523]|uniref:DUF4232 domain-containing protein n=1 Tax=unclassified Streptomyces TaxID=2593676 RepID=UPI002E80C37B|nr:DUF4232 domain-containing protein [Streptomyces sp. NBC_00523]WUD03443.1 DUF4232 domain-containing protein [Streptomyces sp. NBC_00523]
MRLRTALTTAVVTAAATTALTAPAASAATAPCQEKDLRVTAGPGGSQNTARISVVNEGGRACAVDRIPTVTFRGLDGSAQPVPPSTSGPYVLSPGEHGYAAVRTAAPGTTEGHVVRSLSVAADPAHYGVTFAASAVGMADGIRVWEPVTTLWHASPGTADRALSAGTG